ncbi:MAG: hypothetical protein FJ044_04650 [Candidatus Cloacimonetes bacterium]|nr:hypothetical protein [Candidatus Cloacimonadota bacterium]
MSQDLDDGIVYLGPARTRGQRRIDEEGNLGFDIRAFLFSTISDQKTLDVVTSRGEAHGNIIFKRNGRGIESFYFSPRAHPEIVTNCDEFLGNHDRETRAAWVDFEAPQFGILGGDIVCDAERKIRIVQFGYYSELLKQGDVVETFARVNSRLFAARVWVVILKDPITVEVRSSQGKRLQIKPLAKVCGYDDLAYLTSQAFLVDEGEYLFFDNKKRLLYPGIIRRDSCLNQKIAQTERVGYKVEGRILTEINVWGWAVDELKAFLRLFDKSCLSDRVSVETTFNQEEIHDGRKLNAIYHVSYIYFSALGRLKQTGEPRFTIGLYKGGE